MLPNVSTGLLREEVFYVGNAIGETGNRPGSTLVLAEDELLTRSHTRSPLNPAGVDFAYDFDRDRSVNARDQLIARVHRTSPLTALVLLEPEAEAGGGFAAASYGLEDVPSAIEASLLVHPLASSEAELTWLARVADTPRHQAGDPTISTRESIGARLLRGEFGLSVSSGQEVLAPEGGTAMEGLKALLARSDVRPVVLEEEPNVSGGLA